jgi:hypothetical protein
MTELDTTTPSTRWLDNNGEISGSMAQLLQAYGKLRPDFCLRLVKACVVQDITGSSPFELFTPLYPYSKALLSHRTACQRVTLLATSLQRIFASIALGLSRKFVCLLLGWKFAHMFASGKLPRFSTRC